MGIPVNNIRWKREDASPEQKREKRHWLFGKWISSTGVESQQDAGYGAQAPEPAASSYDSVNVPTTRASDGYANQLPATNNVGYNEVESNTYGIQVSRKVSKFFKL